MDVEHLEEDLLVANESYITNGTSYEYEPPTIYYIFHAISMVIYLIGVAANVLICHAILTNRQMRSRTNKVILNWSICDLLFLLITIIMNWLFYFGVYDVGPIAECILWHTDVIFRFLGFVFVGVLMSNRLIRTKALSDRGMLWILWGAAMSLIVVNTNLCILHRIYDVIYIASSILCLSMLITLIWKEVNSCWKQHREAPVSDRTKFRMNIAAIYVYNWFGSWMAMVLSEIFRLYTIMSSLRILYLSGSLSSAYILFYLTRTDKQFKVYMYKILGRPIDVDAIVNFTEYIGEEEGGEEGEVNITIGDDGKVVKRQRE